VANSRGYYLRFPCPDCGATQKVLPAQVGTEIRCTECPAVIVVPTLSELTASDRAINHRAKKPGKRLPTRAPEAPKPTAPPREVNVIHGHLISFICPKCQTMMRAPEDELGHTIMCPTCYSPVVVGGEKHRKPIKPEPHVLVLEDAGDDDYRLSEEEASHAAPPVLAISNGDEDEYRLSEEEDRPPPSRLPPVLETAAEDEPDWGLESEWPRPKPHEPKAAPRRPGPAEPMTDLDLQPRHDRPSLEERLAEVAKANYTDTGPPHHPFLAGVFGFLFYSSSVKAWAGLSFGTILVYYLTTNAVASGLRGGGDLFYSLIFAMMAAAAGLLLVMFQAVAMLAIVQDTAAGNEEVEDWPDFIFVDWVGQAFYVLNAAAFSALPGFLAAAALGYSGPLRVGLTAISFAALFPVMVLSQLDGGSPFSLFTPGVLKGAIKSPLAWGAFYVVSLVVLAAAAGLGWLTLRLVSWSGIPAAVVLGILLATTLLLESRLIGRLAWYCEEEPVPVTSETEEEAESQSKPMD
jgi:ribosomal protein S27E